MKAIRLKADFSSEKTDKANPNGHWKHPTAKLEEVPQPKLRSGELLIQIEYCGICGSDFHLTAKDSNQSVSYPGMLALPITIGHEFSGTVVKHGADLPESMVKKFPIGSLVTSEEMLWCGECDICRAGHVNHCQNLEEIGFTSDGAHAEYISVHHRYCWPLTPLLERFDSTMALQLGALVEPYSVGYRALFLGNQLNRWLPGQSFLILGAGPIGLSALDLALLGGAIRVDIIESDAERRATAKDFGASLILSPKELDRLNQKYDWIVDAAGASDLLKAIIPNNLNVGGSICLLARSSQGLELSSELLITTNGRIFGSQGHSGDAVFSRVIALMAAGKLQALKLIKEIVSPERAIELLDHQKKSPGKTLVKYSI